MSPAPSPARIAVVGGGLAGLTAAATLADAGRDVTVFDKGRGPGGRLSTRRVEPFTFDHGAQYFTARAPVFREEVERWIAAGVAARWDAHLGVLDAREGGSGPHTQRALGDRDERFVGVPGMNSIARHSAAQLGARVVPSVRITACEPSAEHGYELIDEAGGRRGRFDAVLVTTPPSQAAPLVERSATLAAVAADTLMDPCWAVLVAFEAAVPLAYGGAFVNGGPLAWVAHDGSKPGRGGAHTWVLHGSPIWSRAHLEDPADDVAAALIQAFEAALGAALPGRLYTAAHRWRYSAAAPPKERGTSYDAELRLGIAGDWLAGSKVQGAWTAGRELAEALLRAHG